MKWQKTNLKPPQNLGGTVQDNWVTEDAGREDGAKQGEHSGNEWRNLPELSRPSVPHHCPGQDTLLQDSRCYEDSKSCRSGTGPWVSTVEAEDSGALSLNSLQKRVQHSAMRPEKAVV